MYCKSPRKHKTCGSLRRKCDWVVRVPDCESDWKAVVNEIDACLKRIESTTNSILLGPDYDPGLALRDEAKQDLKQQCDGSGQPYSPVKPEPVECLPTNDTFSALAALQTRLAKLEADITIICEPPKPDTESPK